VTGLSKACPRLVVGFDGLTPPDQLIRLVRRGWVAGVVIFARNLESTRQWVDLQQSLVSLFVAGTPIIAVDQEGGLVQRLKAPRVPEVTTIPPMGRCASVLNSKQLEALGRVMGQHLSALGFNLDFAPVLDVHSRAANPIIGGRAFGTDAAEVAERALSWARGLASAGVLGCGKHFPGHGDTTSDSHLELPVVDRPIEALEAVELVPFRRAVEANIPMLMTAHVVYPSLDRQWPATLSEVIIPKILRAELGYDGVVISDDLDMKALDVWRDPRLLAQRLNAADVDLACVCRDLDLAEALGAELQGASEACQHRIRRLQLQLKVPTTAWPLPALASLPDELAALLATV